MLLILFLIKIKKNNNFSINAPGRCEYRKTLGNMKKIFKLFKINRKNFIYKAN